MEIGMEGMQRMLPIHAKAVSQMLAVSFSKDNPLWQSFPVPLEDLTNFFDHIVHSHLKAQDELSAELGRSVTIRGGRVMSCMLNYTLGQYLACQNSPKSGHKLELFRLIQKQAKMLTEGVEFSAYPPHSTIYVNFIAKNMTDRSTTQRKLEVGFQYLQSLKKSGFQYLISRATNRKAVKFGQRLGSKVLKEITMENGGKQFPIFLVQSNLQNPILLNLQQMFLRPKM